MAGSATPAQTAAAPTTEGTAPPTRSKQLIDQLAALVELPPPGMPPQQDEIVADELARASENIERRVKRREHTFTIATGAQGADYDRIGTALIAAVNEAAPNVKLRQRYSEGSVDNAWLLSRGEADYAIVQGDVAAAAFAGEGTFARGGPLATLRAVGGLFPEPIHVVVLPDSPIRTIGQLRGQRVSIGAPASGTRFDALSLLAAHNLKPDELREVSEDPPSEALNKLRSGQLDAVIMTNVTPARMLQQLAVSPGLRLLSIEEAALERLIAERPGLARITLPPNTYPNQREPVVTVAATALLLTTADAPTAEVERVAELVFVRMMPQQQPSNRTDVARASAGTELRGVTIPLHPGAARQP
jgi:TRAP transporter TAXI family solute receptor